MRSSAHLAEVPLCNCWTLCVARADMPLPRR